MADDSISRTMSANQWLLIFLLGLMWGGSFFFIAVALKDLPSFTIVALRTAIAAPALWLLVWATGTRIPRAPSARLAIGLMGFINNAVPYSLMVWAQTQIGSGVASILNATTPLFTAIVAHAFTRDERMTPLSVAAVIVGFVGVAIMIGGAALQSLGSGVLGQLAILAMAMLYALASVFGRRFAAMQIAPIAGAAGQVTASALMLAPVALVIDQPWTLPLPSLTTIGAVLGLGLGSTGLGYVIYFNVLARSGATNLALVTFLAPVSAILLGVGVLGETLAPRHLVGMALIGLGLVLMDGRIPRWRCPALTRSADRQR
jgi:drug/metabolite transporter (DMT)-like permease